MTKNPDSPAPAWVIALLVLSMLMFIGLFVVLSVGDPDDDMSMQLYAIAVALPYPILALTLRRNPRPFAYGALMVQTLYSSFYAALIYLALLLTYKASALWALLLVAPQVALFVWAVGRMRRHGTAGVPRLLLGGLLMFTWPAAAYVASVALSMGIMGIGLSTVASRQQAMVGHVVRLQRCALAYHDASPERGYPRSAEELAAGENACLKSHDLDAGRGNSIQYIPGNRDSAGRVGSFVIRGLTENMGEFYGTAVVADESGILVRNAAARDDAVFRTDGLPQTFEETRKCIVALSVDGAPPREITRAMGRSVPWQQCNDSYISRIATDRRDAFEVGQSGYQFSYASDGQTFRVQARPATYGETALRSYLFTGNRIFVTREDREARETDTELPPCLPEYFGDCVPTPFEAPPRALFVHDSVAFADSTFTLRPGVIGAPDRSPRLSMSFECNADTVPLPTEFPIAIRSGSGNPNYPVKCEPPRWRRPPLGDRIIVRMWMSKDGNRYWAITDTIPFIAPDSVPVP